ncbi:MAG: hypothetical protein OQK46_05700 [Gammaproteobacteria bacterium]|nr:hypothetical protein [Gammaproteobacteria bacterium]
MFQSALMDSWSFFKNHIITLSLIILPIVIPFEIASALYQYHFTSVDTGLANELLPMSISLLLYPIYSVAVVVYISSVISGNKFTLKELYSISLKYWGAYLLITIFIGLIVFGGLMLFIIPGIIFLVRYSFAEFELILNNMKPLDAMSTSWQSTKAYFITLISGYAVIAICLYGPSMALAINQEEYTVKAYTIHTITNIIYAVLNTFFTIYAYRIYEYSKQNKT